MVRLLLRHESETALLDPCSEQEVSNGSFVWQRRSTMGIQTLRPSKGSESAKDYVKKRSIFSSVNFAYSF